jgi:hypothetical protein
MAVSSGWDRNVFGLTGLPVATAPKDARRKIEELRVQVSLGIGPPGMTEEVISDASQTLDDPKIRIEHELLWFWTELAVPVGTKLSSDVHALETNGALAALRQTAGDHESDRATSALHDLAVIHHRLFLIDPN